MDDDRFDDGDRAYEAFVDYVQNLPPDKIDIFEREDFPYGAFFDGTPRPPTRWYVEGQEMMEF